MWVERPQGKIILNRRSPKELRSGKEMPMIFQHPQGVDRLRVLDRVQLSDAAEKTLEGGFD
jgi:hypothetical protein